MVKYAVWLSGLVTFAEAATILNTIGEIPISASSLWRRVAVWGPQCQALEATQRATSLAAPTREELNQTEALISQDLGAAMDGGMVHIREEGWKELKVGCVFAIRQQPTRDKHTGEIVDLAHAVANTYVAHLGGPSVFGDLLWAEARQRHWMQARETIVLGDGASWIWNLTADKFFTSRQVVDWYHAKLHLTQAATAFMAKAPRRPAGGCVTTKLRCCKDTRNGWRSNSANSRRNTRRKRSPCVAKPATFKTTIAACNIWKCAKRVFRSVAAWSRAPASNFGHAWPARACAGHALVWNACCPFAPRS